MDELENVLIFDTTLRDGEQSPGISLNLKEKVEIAEQLARLGVDLIEAGFPISSPGEMEAVEAIARSVRGPIIAGLARVEHADIDVAAKAVMPARRPRIHAFIATSEIHMKAKLRMTPDEVLSASISGVGRARGQVDDVEFTCEDATRSAPDFLVTIFRAVADEGASTLNVPDTVGYALPGEYADLLRYLMTEVDREVVWSVHTHDDLGLAVANGLAGLSAGARQIEVAMNGIGERAGNCSLEEVVMALRTRPKGLTCNVNPKEIARTSRLVSKLTAYPVAPNKAIVGANAFAHESGIHQHAVMAERTTYEVMDPRDVGLDGSRIILGKHSGRHAFLKSLTDLGFANLSVDNVERAFTRFKALAARKTRFTDTDLEAIVMEELGGETEEFVLVSVQVAGGTHMSPTATVRLMRGDVPIEESAIGDGMIDATCGAIQLATGVIGKLESFQVAAVGGGIDALGDVTVVVATHDDASGSVRRATGRGVSTDVVEASARAYLGAINRLVRIGRLTTVRTGSE